MRTIKIELQCSYFVQQRHLAARRISQHPAGRSCRVFASAPAARFPLASRTLPHKVSSLRFALLRYFAGAPFERLQSVGVRILFVLPTLAGALRAFRARRISQHPAGKSCRVFAFCINACGFCPAKFPLSALLRCGTLRGPHLRFPLASRTLPHKVSSLRFAPLRYFAGVPFERLHSVGVRILFVLGYARDGVYRMKRLALSNDDFHFVLPFRRQRRETARFGRACGVETQRKISRDKVQDAL